MRRGRPRVQRRRTLLLLWRRRAGLHGRVRACAGGRVFAHLAALLHPLAAPFLALTAPLTALALLLHSLARGLLPLALLLHALAALLFSLPASLAPLALPLHPLAAFAAPGPTSSAAMTKANPFRVMFPPK